jgi:DNA topoisomerase-3
MTGEWESALNKMAMGRMDADTFHRGIEVYATQIITELLESKIEGGNQRESCPCPKCKSGKVTIFQKVAKCNNESCGLTVFRNKSGKDLTDGQLKDLLANGKTGTIKGFKSKENKPFDAAVVFDAEYKTAFSFPPKMGNSKKRR